MKKLLLLSILFIAFKGNSQEKYKKPFFTTSLATTLAINENYTLFNDEDEPFLLPNSIIFRVGVGYQFNRRILASFHTGFDHHWSYNINAIPTYGTLRVNLTENQGDAFFIESSYGKMWRPSNKFSDGKYYNFGFGFEGTNAGRWRTSFRFIYHRKAILDFENGRLDSFSIGMGFSFF